jgi:hypothetical protein
MVQLVGEHRENHIGLMPMVFVPLPLAVPIVAFCFLLASVMRLYNFNPLNRCFSSKKHVGVHSRASNRADNTHIPLPCLGMLHGDVQAWAAEHCS